MSRRQPPRPNPDPSDGDPEQRRPASLQDEYEERFVRPRGAAPPPPRELRPRPSRFPTGCLTLIAIVFLLFILGPVLLDLSVDWQWFGSVGLQGVFGTRLSAAFAVWIAG